MLQKAKNYFYTIRQLKFIQIRYRIVRKFVKPKYKAYLGVKAVVPGSDWINTSLGRSRISEEKFIFLNKTGHSVEEESKWNDVSREKLWLYNLHYFDDLCSTDAPNRLSLHQSLVNNWIRNNPPGSGNGWEPYPLSLRIVNWIKWFKNGASPEQEWLDSLACQTHWLSQDLEFFILGNHLFANAKALVFAGEYLDIEEASEWLEKGLSILEKEIPEQILSDGANFELSPMYHAIILHDLLDLINLAQCSSNKIFSSYTSSWIEVASRMLGWYESMCHPDGGVSFFNDSAFGISTESRKLINYANHLGVQTVDSSTKQKNRWGTVSSFPDSKYIVMDTDRYKAILDCANIGPDYLPGHAHADTLSFELSLYGQRIFVNSGTSCYGVSDQRLMQRGTAAHNTVVVDEQNSSEVWSGFRVARRAYPSEFNIAMEENELRVACFHDGYQRLKGKVTHYREWQFQEDVVKIIDRLQGGWSSAVAYFYLHPDITLSEQDDKLIIQLGSGKKVSFFSEGEVMVEDSTWHPRFGVSIENKRIVVQFTEPVLRTVIQ